MVTTSELYIAWNNALVDYFITTSTSTVFYVTDSKIEDIGEKYCIAKREDESHVDCFIRAISFFIDKSSSAKANSKGRICYYTLRNNLFNILHIDEYVTQRDKEELLIRNFSKNNATLLDFAVFLSQYKILTDLRSKTELKFAYFPYVIFVLLGFNQSVKRQWCDVEQIFKSYKIYFDTINDTKNVAALFKHLIEENVLTPSCVQTQDEYIKYLKYHSVLTQSDKNLFEEILYKNHIQWNSNMVYGELRNLIWRVGIKSTTAYTKLREALLDVTTRPYFEFLIKNFNREEYELLINSKVSASRTPLQKGNFRYVIDCISLSPQIWLQYIKPTCAVTNNGITLTSIYTYADNFRVDVQNASYIEWANYVSKGLSYDDTKYSITSNLINSAYYFFEIIEGRFLAEMIEPEQLAGKPCFLIIKANCREKYAIINNHRATHIDKNRLSVFPNDWEVYYVPQYVPKQSEMPITEDPTRQLLKYAQLCFDNCITVNRKYLLEAFPYIVTEGLDDLSQDVGISMCDIYGKNVPFKKKYIGNRIYLYDFNTVPCGEIKVSITVDNITETRTLKVVSNTQVLPAVNKTYAKFDKWGCYNNDLTSDYYSDNEIVTSVTNQRNTVNYDLGLIKENKKPYHRLMSILYSIGNGTSPKNTFDSEELDKVLSYLADFEKEHLTEAEIKKLKYALRDLGILTHYYENGKYIYETNTPRLFPLKKGRSITNYGQVTDARELYLLYGTYSQSMYDDLYSAVDHFEYKPLNLTDKLNKYIPPYIVVGLCRNQELSTIQKNNTSYFNQLLNFAGKISDFEQDSNVFRKYTNIDNSAYSYPVMVPSNKQYGRKELLRLSSSEVLDNDKLSPDLLKTYIRYKHKEPVWFEDKENSKNDELYFISEWQLPFYVRKTLVAKEQALPKYLYAFGMCGIFGSERLFSKMFMYKCNDKATLKETLGGGSPMKFESSEISEIGLKMYAIKYIEEGLIDWQLNLYLNTALLCYTKGNTVFYYFNGQYIEVISDKDGNNTVNARLSAVLNLYICCIKSRYNVNEWIKEFLVLNDNTVDMSNIAQGEKYDIKIIKPFINN